MKKQVVFIHGGNAFHSGDDFLLRIKNKEVKAKDFKLRARWHNSLQKALGDDFEVFNPRMPNRENSQYIEWKIWFEKLIPFLNDGVVLVGHSLGAMTLAKYLSENTFPKKIGGLMLVAGPYLGMDGTFTRKENFFLDMDLSGVTNQAGKIFLFQSKDDPLVPFSDFEIYKEKLPTAQCFVYEDRGHFNGSDFPELVELIKKP